MSEGVDHFMLAGIPIETLTPAGMLGMVFLLTMGGFIVPRRTMNERIATEKRRGDEYYAACLKKDETIALLSAQLAASLDQGRITNAILGASPGPSTSGKP